jgi:hypothetical protein
MYETEAGIVIVFRLSQRLNTSPDKDVRFVGNFIVVNGQFWKAQSLIWVISFGKDTAVSLVQPEKVKPGRYVMPPFSMLTLFKL